MIMMYIRMNEVAVAPNENVCIKHMLNQHHCVSEHKLKIKHCTLWFNQKPPRYVTCRLEHWKALHGFPEALHRWGRVRALPYHCETMMNEGAWTWTVNKPNQTKTEQNKKPQQHRHTISNKRDKTKTPPSTHACTYTFWNISMVMKATLKHYIPDL